MKRTIQAIQRYGTVLILAGMASAVAGIAVDNGWPVESDQAFAIFLIVGLVLIVTGLAAVFAPGGDRTDEPRAVRAPVQGRWLAMNSPATKVPSHGTRAYGQSHAVDLVFDPEDRPRPEFGAGAGMRPPSDFPAFGQPVLAPVAGRVVGVRDDARDHRSRSRWWAVLYMLVEGMIREIGGARHIVGNHIVIDTGDGCFALVAHLRRDSAEVGIGDVVQAGQRLGQCGNSGNSSEPHVHVQLMDRASLSAARGMPMIFTGVTVGSAPGPVGMPANGEHMVAG
ncbi:M23 family metallopeptidase [Haloactinopolyspora sp.]|uniref:M23 family metallopeptidase n=1 Tax=Haloactinopolyspora sp. TaxID=1966353 RepID=UPI0026020739|nr:M23 family metallopeptidase [Haloactinopolyspora sp.]